MTLILDAGALIALADRRDPMQEIVERVLRNEPGVLVLPAPVSTEVDHVLGRRVGASARRAFLEDLVAARYAVECLEAGDYATVAELNRSYAGLGLGLADIAIIVMAERFDTVRIATFDQRHFRAVRPLQGGSFTLLPMDEERLSP